MVGVPGRSKACHTCKRRKKGCDQQEPACGQCKRAGIFCAGYENALIFVNSSQQHGDASTQSFLPKSYTPLSPAKSSTLTFAPWHPCLLIPDTPPLLEGSLARVAMQSQYFDNFWSSLLPNGQGFSDEAARYSTLGWTGMVRELCHRDNLVRLALLANALAVLGEQSGERYMILEGWRAYGKTLRILARSLPAGCDGKADEFLITSQLLSQYEILQGAVSQRSASASGARWFRHVFGETAIILSQGPEHYVKGRAHQLFIDARLHLIYSNIRNRKQSPFSSPEWKSIPWSLSPKDPKNELLDILIDIPGIQEDLDLLLDCPSDQSEKQILFHQSLEQRCWLHDSQLQQWASTSGSSTVNFVKSQILDDHQDISPPSSEDFAMAHLGLLYWTTCFLLYQCLGHLNICNPTKHPGHVEPRQYCRKILLLLPYFQKPNIGEFFMNITAFSAVTVSRFLDRNDLPQQPSEEREMLLKAFSGRYQHQMQNFIGTWPWRIVNRR